jgi:hypothetical protein
MKTARIIALLLDFGLLAFVGYCFLKSGAPATAADLIPLSLICGTALLNICVILWLNPTSLSPGWVALYLRRKALEEQKKIDSLQGK